MVDAIAGTTTRYYYDDQRVAVQTLVSGSVETDDRYFVFGNFIDEVLLMHRNEADKYYLHDHLYSSVALLNSAGAVLERYEYDAYGKVQILTSAFSPLSSSQYGNPYYFTGREVDWFDNGNLTLQYNRHRYLSQYMGSWFTPDPRGYVDGLSLYAYVNLNSVAFLDALGLSGIPASEVQLIGIRNKLHKISSKDFFRGCDVCVMVIDVSSVGRKKTETQVYPFGRNPNTYFGRIMNILESDSILMRTLLAATRASIAKDLANAISIRHAYISWDLYADENWTIWAEAKDVGSDISCEQVAWSAYRYAGHYEHYSNFIWEETNDLLELEWLNPDLAAANAAAALADVLINIAGSSMKMRYDAQTFGQKSSATRQKLNLQDQIRMLKRRYAL